jgi:CTP:molybdopterin cytidylyltransferase MocA
MTADREPQTEAERPIDVERAEQVLTYVEAALDANRAGRATGVSAALMKAEHALRALLAAPAPQPEAAALDVERLARALRAEAASGRWDGEDGPMRWSSLTLAALIAAEYERPSDDAYRPIPRLRAEAQPLDWDEAVAVARALAAPDPDP